MSDFTITSKPIYPELQKYDAFWRPTDYAVLNGATRDNCIRPIIKKEAVQAIKQYSNPKVFTKMLESRVFFFGKIPQSALGPIASEMADKWYNKSEMDKSTYADVFNLYQYCGDWFTRTAPAEKCELSDGQRAVPDEHYWCRLSMIDWFEDPKTGNWISISPLMPNTPEARKQLLKVLNCARKELLANTK